MEDTRREMHRDEIQGVLHAHFTEAQENTERSRIGGVIQSELLRLLLRGRHASEPKRARLTRSNEAPSFLISTADSGLESYTEAIHIRPLWGE